MDALADVRMDEHAWVESAKRKAARLGRKKWFVGGGALLGEKEYGQRRFLGKGHGHETPTRTPSPKWAAGR